MKAKTSCICLFLLFACVRAGLQYQTLTLRPLSSLTPQKARVSLSKLKAHVLSQSEPAQTANATATTKHSLLRLEHVHTLNNAKRLAPKDILKHRLERDARRVKAILAIISRSEAKAYEIDSINNDNNNNNNNNNNKNKSTGFTSSIISGYQYECGEFFVRLGLGTPPRILYLILDTGSDTSWVQSKPCQDCYSQIDPIYDSKNSTSYMAISCSSETCKKLHEPGCKSEKCAYEVQYGDTSFTTGELAMETLSFHKTNIENFALGLGHLQEGLFQGADGLLGLGNGPLSFPTQAKQLYDSKFSYCLVDIFSNRSSWALFGPRAASKTTQYMPLLKNPAHPTFYYLGLTEINVGGVPVKGIEPSMFTLDEKTGQGGVLIDSGTAITRLLTPAYDAVRDAFRETMKALNKGLVVTPVSDFLDTCYDLSGKKDVKVPSVELKFGELSMAVNETSVLIAIEDDGTFCFAFAPIQSKLSIIGSIQQQGFRMVYDLADQKIGLAAGQC